MTSILAALGMALFGGGHLAAQLPFVLLAAAASLIAFRIAELLGGDSRLAWLGGPADGAWRVFFTALGGD